MPGNSKGNLFMLKIFFTTETSEILKSKPSGEIDFSKGRTVPKLSKGGH